MTTAAYIRVSTQEQDYERQRDNIADIYSVDEWFSDVTTGTVMTGRDGLEDLLARVGDFDTIVFDEVSRLGRSAREMRDTAQTMRDHDVTMVFRSEGVTLSPDDDDHSQAQLIFDILSWLAGKESEIKSERIRTGIERARRNGKHLGNPPLGYVVQDGFLVESDDVSPSYTAVNTFIREVNRGRPKKTTARFFGVEPNSAQNVLDNSCTVPAQYDDPYYDVTYVGDYEWNQRRNDVRAGKTTLPVLEVEG